MGIEIPKIFMLLAIQEAIKKNLMTSIIKSLSYSTAIKIAEVYGKLISTKLILGNFTQ